MNSILEIQHPRQLGLLLVYFIIVLLHNRQYIIDLQTFVDVTLTSQINNVVDQEQLWKITNGKPPSNQMSLKISMNY